MYFSPDSVRQRFERQSTSQPNLSLTLPIVYERMDRTRWEYFVVTVDLREEAPLSSDRLNELGSEGWLLSSALEEPARQPDHPPRYIHYYFVRAA